MLFCLRYIFCQKSEYSAIKGKIFQFLSDISLYTTKEKNEGEHQFHNFCQG